jgi:hypothetical protein
LGREGPNVLLRGNGSKYDGVDWFWDLTDIGLGTIRSVGDTSVFVDRVIDGEVYLSQVGFGEKQTPRIPVQFKTHYHVVDDVPFTISQANSNFNGYVFGSIGVAANINRVDRDYVDSIVIFLPNNSILPRINLLPANDFSGSMIFTDTGTYRPEARIYGAVGGVYREASFDVRVGVDFAIAGNLQFEVDDIGSSILLRATGYKADGVYWEWGLSRVNSMLANRRTMLDTTTVNFSGAIRSDTIFLSQVRVDTILGTIEELRIQRAFVYNTSLKTYRVNIEIIGDASVDFALGRSFTVNSGQTTDISYIFRDEVKRTFRSMVTRVDSIVVNGGKLPWNDAMGGTSQYTIDRTLGSFRLNAIRSDMDVKFYAQIHLVIKFYSSSIYSWYGGVVNNLNNGGEASNNHTDGRAEEGYWLRGYGNSEGGYGVGGQVYDCPTNMRLLFSSNKKLATNTVWDFIYVDEGVEKVLQKVFVGGGGMVADSGGISDYGIGLVGESVLDELLELGGENMELYEVFMEPANRSLRRIKMSFVDALTGQRVFTELNIEWVDKPGPMSGGCTPTEANYFCSWRGNKGDKDGGFQSGCSSIGYNWREVVQ